MTTKLLHMPSTSTVGTSAAPPYPAYELTNLTTTATTTTNSSRSSLPAYEDALGAAPAAGTSQAARALTVHPTPTTSLAIPCPFTPTQMFRIDASGHPVIALPVGPRPDPIPVYDVTHGPLYGRPGAGGEEPTYVSVRQKRSSGTCQLLPGHDADAGADAAPLCTTTYRFGPGRPPVLSLHGGRGSRGSAAGEGSFEIVSKRAFSRAQILKTHLGTFTWRYATRSERRVPSLTTTGASTTSTSSSSSPASVDSILIMSRTTAVSTAYGSKPQTVETEVARLVRTRDTRTPGTARCTAGNGGLLLVDLREWACEKGGVGGGGGGSGEEEEEARLLVVASCIAMLKKEIDRRRAQQMMALGAIVSS